MVYSDTYEPVEQFIEKNKHLRKLIIEEDGLSLDDFGDMEGMFGHQESQYLNRFVSKYYECK